MLKYFSENHERDERTYIDKDGDEIARIDFYWLPLILVDLIVGLY